MLVRPSEHLGSGRPDDVSTRFHEWMPGNRPDGFWLCKQWKKKKIKRMAQKCYMEATSYLPRSGLTQSPSTPGLGSRPVGRDRSPEAWAPLGAANPCPRPAGGAPAPRGPGVPCRPGLRPGQLALHVPPRRRREPRVSRGAARSAPGPGSAVHGHCDRQAPSTAPPSGSSGQIPARRGDASWPRARPPLRLRGCRAPRRGRAAPVAGSLAAFPAFQTLAALPAPTRRPGPQSAPSLPGRARVPPSRCQGPPFTIQCPEL